MNSVLRAMLGINDSDMPPVCQLTHEPEVSPPGADPADRGTSDFAAGGKIQGEPTRNPVKTLEDLRHLLNSGQLDGRPLRLCGYLYEDIGAEVSEHLALHDKMGGLHSASYSANKLREVMRALQSEAA